VKVTLTITFTGSQGWYHYQQYGVPIPTLCRLVDYDDIVLQKEFSN